MKIFSALNLCLLVGLGVTFSLRGDALKDFDSYVEAAYAASEVPGIAIAIVKDNKIIFAKGYGICRVGSEEKVDGDTIFQLASVSKTFAAAGLGVLVDQGKLKWDEEVMNFLPGFALRDIYASRYTTSKDLLAHRTGLPAFHGDLLGELGYSSEDILYRLRFIPLAKSFRAEGLYSNLGFFAAGELLKSTARMPWLRAIQISLLTPLEMHRTGGADNLKKANVAFPHAKIDESIKVIPRNVSEVFIAAGGLSSSAQDMAKWMIMHLNEGLYKERRVLSAQTIKEIFTPAMVVKPSFSEMPPISEDSGFCYTLGWGRYSYLDKVIIEKGGALDGVRSVVTLIPELKMGIVILANLNLTVLPERIRAQFLQTYVGKDPAIDVDRAFEESQKLVSNLLQMPSKPKDLLPLQFPLEIFLGAYYNEIYGTFDVVKNGDMLSIEAGESGYRGSLTHWGSNTFLLRWPHINAGHEFVTFVLSPQGAVTHMHTETLGSFEKK